MREHGLMAAWKFVETCASLACAIFRHNQKSTLDGESGALELALQREKSGNFLRYTDFKGISKRVSSPGSHQFREFQLR